MTIRRAYSCVCDRCGHEWFAVGIPKQCAKCRRRDWHGEERGGWVYVAGIRGNDLVKVGQTSRINARIAALRHPVTGGKVELLMSLAAVEPLDLEQAIHRHFVEQRQQGEWFTLSVSDLEWLKSAEFVHPGSVDSGWVSHSLTCVCHPPKWFQAKKHTIPVVGSSVEKVNTTRAAAEPVRKARACPRGFQCPKLHGITFCPACS